MLTFAIGAENLMRAIDIIISATSFALFFYWFQYVCLLILSARTGQDYSGEIGSTIQLGFPEVRSKLQNGDADLDSLRRCLERDYAILVRLLKLTPHFPADDRREVAMLKIHYRIMRAWFCLTRKSMRTAATHALEEMWLVVVHLANSIGERQGALPLSVLTEAGGS
jgi:G:T-mismatch repair DNA endonuclease (very short patch repair protein)